MPSGWCVAYLQVSVWELLRHSTSATLIVLICLLLFSVVSWAIIFAKWSGFRRAQESNRRFLRAFRKAPALQSVAMAVEQFPAAPMVSVFNFGYSEVDRQMSQRGQLVNRPAIERSLQLGISEEIAKLESNMNWLATIATVTPFIGLFGTVWGIINAFQSLSSEGGNSLRAVGPGIAEALVATAMGLAAAIPAAIFYNYLGNIIRETGTRLEDFSLEFLNLMERQIGG